MTGRLSTRMAIALFVFVVVAWGLNWVVAKVIVAQVTPLWTVAIRTGVAVLALAPALLATGRLVMPKRGDVPIILAVSLFHMVAFAALMTAGLKYMPVGRSVVLGYTTPLWVAPAAWFFLKEPMPPRRIFGIALGLAGLLFMFNPRSFDWQDGRAWLGNGLCLLSAVAWSVTILYTRVHRWISTPVQLLLWQAFLAASVLTALACIFEGPPQITWTTELAVAFAYNGIIGTALGYWAMIVVNSHVPATTTSLGVLATPVVGMGFSAVILGEGIDMSLILAATMIISGIAIGTTREHPKVQLKPAPAGAPVSTP